MKLSIITINYNNKTGLLRTLESVARQTSEEFEYIVIDGGSTDGSVNLLNQYRSHISYCVSEKDSGIYNAMNKGIRNAHGEYSLFLNSGDVLNSPDVVEAFNNLSEKADIITGIERFVKYDDNGFKTVLSENHSPREIVSDIFILSSISHGSSFIKTQLLKKNPYDETLSIVSDWKFFLEALLVNQNSYYSWDFPINDFDATGISNTQKEKRDKERHAVLFGIAPERLIADYVSLLNGRNELERMIRHERPDGLLIKILTIVGRLVLKTAKFVKR